jgi:putative oxidoreductase
MNPTLDPGLEPTLGSRPFPARGATRWWGRIQQAWQGLDRLGAWLGPLSLRLLLAWEFWESGREKWRGENWFSDIQDQFPWPFSVIDPHISWQMATWTELLGALALLLGLATRFAAVSLMMVTIVATLAVHWPAEWHSLAELARGYVITDDGYGNYKLPLIFGVMLWTLIWRGGGPFSLDALVARVLRHLTCPARTASEQPMATRQDASLMR